MNYRIHITSSAERDINNAVDYIDFTLKNPDAADNLLDAAEEQIGSITVYYLKALHKGYCILNRAIFYVSRLVSSQKERDFTGSNYDDIKQVFSIWICMNMKENILSHIHLVKDEKLNPFDWKGNLDLLNIIMVGVTNDIPEREEKYELHRLISALLSDDLQMKEKLAIIGDEYNIPIKSDFREDVNIMCNLAEGIEERAIARTREEDRKEAKKATKKAVEKATKSTSEKFIMSMYRKGYTLEQIADVADISKDDVKSVITRKSPAMS